MNRSMCGLISYIPSTPAHILELSYTHAHILELSYTHVNNLELFYTHILGLFHTNDIPYLCWSAKAY